MVRRSLFVLVSVAVAVVGFAFTNRGNERAALSRNIYFSLFDSDYEPAETFDELSARSDVVVVANLLRVEDGATFLSDGRDSSASRTLRLVFAAKSDGTEYQLDLPRPRNLSWEKLAQVFPAGCGAILYLVDVLPDMSSSELAMWRNLPRDHYWQFTTPQGFILKPPAGSWYQPEIETEPQGLDRRPEADDQWLPISGEKALRPTP